MVNIGVATNAIARSSARLDNSRATFTAGMAKRAGQVFAAAPIVQGKWDGTGTPDVLSFPRGAQIADLWYATFDPYQGGGFCEWVPEQSTGDGTGMHYLGYVSSAYSLAYDYDNDRYALVVGTQTMTVAATLTAGTPEILAWGFDTRNDLDGTNYAYFSRSDTQAFGITVQPTTSAPDATIYVGSDGTAGPLNGIPEGLVFVREIPWTGTCGTDMGLGDVVAAHYAAGAGADIAETIGAWGTTFSLPTDSAVGALTTGTGNAWSMSHGDNQLEESWATDGYGPDQQWCLTFDGSGDDVDCGSAAALDNLPDDAFTVDGWFLADGWGENGTGNLIDKGRAAGVGWAIIFSQSGSRITLWVDAATTDAETRVAFSIDNEWHHIAMFFDDAGDRKIYCAIDGAWVASYQKQQAAVGAVTNDVNRNLIIGNRDTGARTWDGRIGWMRLSDNDRHSHGTGFTPPRTMPGADGNTIEQWSMEDGSGATVVASVTSPGNDGTITGATWTGKWADEGTPVALPGLEYNGTTTSCVVADAAAIQDLHDAAFTVEAWIRADALGENDTARIFDKTDAGVEGWYFSIGSTGLRGYVEVATTDADSTSGADEFISDRRLHHVCMQFDDGGARTISLWIDGIPVASYPTQQAANGAVVTDVGNDLYLGNRSDGARTWDGLLGGWARISDVLRYTNGKAFVPSPPTTAPAVDGNTAWQTDYSDGAGATLTDDSGNGNDGALTNHTWGLYRDLANLQGEQNYEWGYVTGSDAANEGITQTLVGLTPDDDYHVSVCAAPSADGTAQMQLIIYDETNAANILVVNGPTYVGTHDGAGNAATLADSGARWIPGALVGATLYNVTDGSSTTITANTATTCTGTLSGGTDDDWDAADQYRIVWAYASGYGGYPDHPWVEDFGFELPALCTSISATLTNVAATGTVFIHQINLQPDNLWNDPGMEAGTAPTNVGTPTTSAQDAGQAHSATNSWKVVADAANEGIKRAITTTSGKFYHASAWVYADIAGTVDMEGPTGQDGSAARDTTTINDGWERLQFVFRATGASTDLQFTSNAAQTFYVDDVAVIELDDVSLTVTPASEANSAENSGERVDGRDQQAQAYHASLDQTEGRITFKVRPRHAPANLIAFAEAGEAVLVHIAFADGHYLEVRSTAANQLTIAQDDGGGEETTNYDATGAWAADGYGPDQQWCLTFDGSGDDVDCGSAAALDNLPDDAFTVDGWFLADGWGENGTGNLIDKGRAAGVGWAITLSQSGSRITLWVDAATTDAETGVTFSIDNEWHHIAMFFDDAGDRKIYCAIDGAWVASYEKQQAAVGAVTNDVNRNLIIGNRDAGARTWDGRIGWMRLSDNDRHSHGTGFTPPRTMPAADGNTIEQWSMEDGSGATVAATVTSPGNDGTITGATWTGKWAADDELEIELGYGSFGNSLVLDGAVAATGNGAPTFPAGAKTVYLGSDENGANQFDMVCINP